MDNRTGFRPPRGHAGHAAQARRALGVAEFTHLDAVPLPLAHMALGIAACACAVLVRVTSLGVEWGTLGTFLVALLTGAGLLAYDWFIYPPEGRLGADGVALPVAAVGAFGIVLATSRPLGLLLVGGLIGALIIGGVPHLGERRRSGSDAPPLRLARDLAAILVVIPFLFAATATELALLARLAVVGVGVGLAAYDNLRLETPQRAAAIGSLACGLVVAAAVGIAARGFSSGGPGIIAAVLLLIWYGIRGLAASLLSGRRGLMLVAEHLVIVIVGLLALAWVGSGR